jgi:HTH-type transcriptional regulator/antitoxin HipB
MKHKILPKGKISSITELGQFIVQRRKSMGLTQSEFAALCNAGTRFISELENGKETVRLGKVLKVLENLGYEIHLLPRDWSK